MSVYFFYVSTRPPQDVDDLAVMDFQIPRPETLVLYPKSLLTNHEIRGRKLGRKGGLQRTGRRASKIQNCKDVDVGCPRERFLAISSVSTNVHG